MKFACYLSFAVLLVAGCNKASDATQTLSLNADASLQCHKDTDCKGDRICTEGACVAPAVKDSRAQSAESTKGAVAAAREIAEPKRLDDMFRGLNNGCGYDRDAGLYKIVEAYIGKVEDIGSGRKRAKLLRPNGDEHTAPFFGKADLVSESEYFGLKIPVLNGVLYGIPVSEIFWYGGIGNGFGGVDIEFSVPMSEVKKILASSGVKFSRYEDFDFEPELKVNENNSSHTDLLCDHSM